MKNYDSLNWTLSEKSKLSKIDTLDKNSNSDKYTGNDILREMFLVKKIHEKKGCKLEDSLIKWINPNYNLNLLYDFDKAVSYIESNSIDLYNASKSGLFPITALYHFGNKCIKMDKVKGKKSYTLKITPKQFAQVIKYLKLDSHKISSDSVKETINSFFPKKKSAPKSKFVQCKDSFNKAKNLIKLNGFTSAQKLELQAIALIINAYLIETPKKQVAKKVAPKKQVAKKITKKNKVTQ